MQQTRLQYATAKIARFSIKMHASQPDGQLDWMLTIFCTQVPALGVKILVNVQVILRISIFWFVNPTLGIKRNLKRSAMSPPVCSAGPKLLGIGAVNHRIN